MNKCSFGDAILVSKILFITTLRWASVLKFLMMTHKLTINCILSRTFFNKGTNC